MDHTLQRFQALVQAGFTRLTSSPHCHPQSFCKKRPAATNNHAAPSDSTILRLYQVYPSLFAVTLDHAPQATPASTPFDNIKISSQNSFRETCTTSRSALREHWLTPNRAAIIQLEEGGWPSLFVCHSDLRSQNPLPRNAATSNRP